jgi:hypothetical protein
MKPRKSRMNPKGIQRKTMTEPVPAPSAAVAVAGPVRATILRETIPTRLFGFASLAASKMRTSRVQPASKPKSNADARAAIKADVVHRF